MSFPDRRHDPLAWILPVFTLASLVTATVLIVIEATRSPMWPMDAYHYVSKALGLVTDMTLKTAWSTEVDAKFFPGYSVALAGFSLVCLTQPWFWIVCQVTTHWLCAALLHRVARGLGLDRGLAWVPTLIWVSHPIVLKWIVYPMAEPWAVVCALGAVCAYQSGQRAPRATAALLAGALAGWAISTRVEMIALLFPLIMHCITRRRLPRPRWMALGSMGLLVGLLPLLLWIGAVVWGSSAGHLAYFTETASHGLNPHWWRYIPRGLYEFGRLTSVGTGSEVLDIYLFVVHLGLVVSVVLALGGWLGRWGAAAAALLLLYIAGHTLWHYFYERFLIPTIPLAALLVAAGGRLWLHRTTGPIPAGHTGRRLFALALICFTSVTWLHYASVLMRDHRQHLANAEPWDPIHLVAMVEERTPRGSPVLTDLGPPLAFHLGRPVFFDSGLQDFYEPGIERHRAGEAIVALGIHAVITRLPPEQWLDEAAIPAALRPAFDVVPTGDGVTYFDVDVARLSEWAPRTGL